MIEEKVLQDCVAKRYQNWQGDLGKKLLSSDTDLAMIASHVAEHGIDPKPKSAQQELLENYLMHSQK